MGCPGGSCTGYEIGTGAPAEAVTIDLGVAPHNTGEGWVPIPSYSGVLEGNGNTIDGLFINRAARENGLFDTIASGAQVRNLRLTNASVTGTGASAVLADLNNGVVSAVFVSGEVTISVASGATNLAAGLVGANNTGGEVRASGSSVAVSGTAQTGIQDLGGLVGHNCGKIIAGYAWGSVSCNAAGGAATTRNCGGLVGTNATGGNVVASYSTGAVSVSGTAPINIKGLVGNNSSEATIADSYWDTTTTRLHVSSPGSEGKTTAELIAPTGYTGIYANWNVDIDGDGSSDDPWDFVSSTDYRSSTTAISPPPASPSRRSR